MATGDLPAPTRRQRRQIDQAIRRAEAYTGLQLCVFLGPTPGREAREEAESLFVEAGLLDRPAVLLLVDPPHRHVEVVTGPEARQRIPDEEAATAVTAMTAAFAAGNLATGLIAGIQHLADVAGPGEPPPDGTDLANVIGGG